MRTAGKALIYRLLHFDRNVLGTVSLNVYSKTCLQ